ncbi:MAG: helix-turn-helix transcriptional regulator [Cytophagales bacterium]|nr:helix-turn-helix transcriptional regulator [Cytophagales bacterium]
MEINQRISTLIDKLGYNKSTFAQKTGISQPIITHITNGRNNPGLEVIQKILTNCQEVNPDWLILGIGEMTLNNKLNRKLINDLISDINNDYLKLIDEANILKDKINLLQEMLQKA